MDAGALNRLAERVEKLEARIKVLEDGCHCVSEKSQQKEARTAAGESARPIAPSILKRYIRPEDAQQ